MRAASPIDFALVRRGLCAAISACTGLGQNNVLMANPELRGAPLPAYPFVVFAFTGAGRRMGPDAQAYSAADKSFVLSGPRELGLNIDCYGATHEDAYGLAAILQQGLDGPECDDGMSEAGLSVWQMGEVLDLSTLEPTGFQGRARLTCRFGVAARRVVNLGEIKTVPLHGIVAEQAGSTLVIDTTVTLET